jgi:protein-serine/threonine kinase
VACAEKPSPWKSALARKYEQVRNRFSSSAPRANPPSDDQEEPEACDEAGTAYTQLEVKYGKRWQTIGRGAYGTVSISRKVDKESHSEELFAVKEFHRRPSQHVAKYRDRVLAEYSLVSDIRHANVIRILDLFHVEQDRFYEVMEFCAGGDLFSLVQTAGRLEVGEAGCFMKQLMRGVKYLHEIGVAHCDLKPENLLLTTTGGLKITDFGFCQYLVSSASDEIKLLSGIRGSVPYIAPEEYTDDEFDGRSADVWACGVIYMFMHVGRHLWHSAQKKDEFYLTYVKDRRVEKGYAPIESLGQVSSSCLRTMPNFFGHLS